MELREKTRVPKPENLQGMRIGGLQKLSLIDYPDNPAVVIFTQGCNFRCRYCHNPELVLPKRYCSNIPEENVIEILKRRRKYLEHVVVSGGEPTVQKDLIVFLKRVKALGYSIKLDTNGSCPDILDDIIVRQLVDFIAMDVKAPFEKYQEIIDVNFSSDRIKESIEIILRSGIMHEFRTTVARSLCSCDDLTAVVSMFQGARKYTVQNFQYNDKTLDQNLSLEEQYTDMEISDMKLKWEMQGS